MSEELKPCPCPFCGLDPYIGECRDGWYAECANDECTHSPDLKEMFHMRDQVIKAWNTRHIPEGYKLLPVEMEMDLGFETVRLLNGVYDLTDVIKVYKAMVEAAE